MGKLGGGRADFVASDADVVIKRNIKKNGAVVETIVALKLQGCTRTTDCHQLLMETEIKLTGQHHSKYTLQSFGQV